jgi:hypothetical protein
MRPIALLTLAILAASLISPDLLARESPKNVIAAHIRAQGFPCAAPQSAVRQPRASRPNGQVWVLKCKNAIYRVRLVPDMAAKIERLGKHP